MLCGKILVGALVLLSVCSCGNKAQRSLGIGYSDFPAVRHLQGEGVETDTVLFRYAFRIRVNDNVAAVMDLHGLDHYCHLFKYPEFHYLTSLGKRGDSPGEILSAENIRFRDNSLWILDSNKNALVGFENFLSGDSLLRVKTVSLDKKLLRSLDFTAYDDSTYLIPDYSGANRFCRIDADGRFSGRSGSIPSVRGDVGKPALAQAWRSFIDYNPRNGVLAAVTQLGEVVEICHPKDSFHVVRVGPCGEPKFKVSPDGYGIPTGIIGFSDVQVTDRAIYTVFHGRSLEKLIHREESSDGGKYIYVFSLQGEPLCKYVLDRYIYGIYVDEKNRVIVATDVNSDQPIVRFRLGDECIAGTTE